MEDYRLILLWFDRMSERWLHNQTWFNQIWFNPIWFNPTWLNPTWLNQTSLNQTIPLTTTRRYLPTYLTVPITIRIFNQINHGSDTPDSIQFTPPSQMGRWWDIHDNGCWSYMLHGRKDSTLSASSLMHHWRTKGSIFWAWYPHFSSIGSADIPLVSPLDFLSLGSWGRKRNNNQ